MSNGKGSARRPSLVPRREYDERWAATFTVGPRIEWWRCEVCGALVEWHEDSGEPRLCWQCRADPDDYARENGVYRIDSIGSGDAKWEATKEEDHE